MSRTKNATRNIISGLISKMVYLVFPFIIRSVIIQTLGSEYLGLSSLFTSILQVLNLAEMGFSGAIIYSMYKPIAERDMVTVCGLMNLYKKIYRIIGIIILLIGLAIMPFLPNLIEGNVPVGANIYMLYMLYLFNTVSTYFLFAYKGALLNAYQRNDIASNIYTLTGFLRFIGQIVVLLVFKNYYVYVIVQCITSILNNIVVAIVVKQKYPKCVCCGEVSKEQKKDIRKKVTGIMIQKICITTRNSFDSIFISSMVGLTAVAIYSNYYMIMVAVASIIGILASSIKASVGNSIVTESVEKNYNDMNKFNFVYMWISGWLTVCLVCLYQPLMEMWMGGDNMFSYAIVILFCIYFYSLECGEIRFVYTEAKGLWYENKHYDILEAILNIVLNLVLGHFFGVYGIIIGTLLSLLIINFGCGSRVLFKYYFTSQKVSEYFLRHGLYALVTVIICVITYFVCSMVRFDGVLGFTIKGFICIGLPKILYIVAYRNTKMFGEATRFVKKILRKR